MRIIEATIRAAFEAHGRVWGEQRGWKVTDHVDCWNKAYRAFDEGRFADFEQLYAQLRGLWQVFRRSNGPPWTDRETFDQLGRQDNRLRSLSLRDLNDGHLDGVWTVIANMSGIKPTKAPSVVAISKFLHFWNPRLFVIVDDAIMWQRVLSRSWLKTAIETERKRITSLVSNPVCPKNATSCELLSYLAILVWASTVVRRNPELVRVFAEYVRGSEGVGLIEFPIEFYDAAAVEWCLLGLAEIPPPGVDLSSSRCVTHHCRPLYSQLAPPSFP